MIKVIILFLMAVLSCFDLREKKIPVIILLAAGILTVIYTVFFILCSKPSAESLAGALLGAVPGIMLSFIAIITKKVGMADGIVLTLLGMLTDYCTVMQILCLSMIIMALLSIILLVLKRIKKNSELPYLPFLTMAFLVICLYKS